MDASAQSLKPEVLLAESRWIHALAHSLVGDPGAADDLVQETWIAALRERPGRGRPLRPWLAAVLRRLALQRRRSEGRRERRERDSSAREALPSTHALVERVETQRLLASAVLTLEEPYRTTVLLRYYEGRSSAEIAREQGIPAGTVRWRACLLYTSPSPRD